jgi:hypothetical protein
MIDPEQYGISFSIKQCRGFGIDPSETLTWLLEQGWRRFRLMSYWDEHEKHPGDYDFASLDTQIALIRAAGGSITLCLGARQPRWPENHWPEWAWIASKQERTDSLLRYIETVVKRYQSEACIVSYQLENEALLKSFGRRAEVDRDRLRREFKLIKHLDPSRPVIMSTSNSWGIPFRRPIPDLVGFSYYHIAWNGNLQRYTNTGHSAYVHKMRALLIRLLLWRRSFIHELQCEPWAPKAIWEVSIEEQDRSMSAQLIVRSIQKAKKTGLAPTDLWGAEWWYWRHLRGDDVIIQVVKNTILAD